ncbi:MAG TPA: squalene/phytoene synthase family protein [Planctomycetota bacterium]|nr:MAG: All-trans-phytoene synthase [Planctomycetes bacterium ADurb.Bin069]HPY70628.1 squalene/phytoene synthase family protein [Planctomycetota bacterium]
MRSTPTCDAMAPSERRLLGPRLKATSRSFYLSVRILPRGMRRPVGLAYLLARAADTLADSWGGPGAARTPLLDAFRACLAEAAAGRTPRATLPPAPTGVPEAERELLDDLPAAFAFLASLPRELRAPIETVVATLAEGMRTDLTRFADASPTAPVALTSAADLDRYTYLIAGCVGAFWTDLTILTGVWPAAARDTYAAWGVRFGQGLQLINILRDMRGDAARGRVYLPEEELRPFGLAPRDLLAPETFERLRPLFLRHVAAARAHLAEAPRYIRAIPRRRLRLRLAALWPLWIGLRTLTALEACPNPLAAPPVRIPRGAVYRLMARSVVFAPSARLLDREFVRLGGRNPPS